MHGHMNLKYVCCYFLQNSATFLILRRIQRDTITNVQTSSHKVPVLLVRFDLYVNFPERFSKNTQISSFMRIGPVAAELFHADGRTGWN